MKASSLKTRPKGNMGSIFGVESSRRKGNTVIKRLFACFKSEKQNLAVYTSLPVISDSRKLKQRQRRHQQKSNLKV